MQTGLVHDAAERLLLGPRGRRLCLEYVRLLDEGVDGSLSWFAQDIDPNPGVILRMAGDDAPAEHPSLTAADVATKISDVDLANVDSDFLRTALRASLDAARYWQEPDGNDLAAALPEIRSALMPVAALLVASLPDLAAPRAATQWAVDWNPAAQAAPLFTAPDNALRTWTSEVNDEERRSQRERPADPRANWSGTWWSVPLTVLETRGSVEAARELMEDSFGWTAATFIPVRGSGTVLEIASAKDWAELCRAYPVEVTASRRHDWYRTTGRDGRWVMPDWERVASAWDSVHLTTLAYLSAATQLIPVDDEFATIIAGWAPDSTLWLRDVVREADAPRQEWSRPSDQDPWTRRPRTSDWEFFLGQGGPSTSELRDAHRRQFERLRELIAASMGGGAFTEHADALTTGIRDLAAAGASIDLIAAELGLSRAFVEDAIGR